MCYWMQIYCHQVDPTFLHNRIKHHIPKKKKKTNDDILLQTVSNTLTGINKRLTSPANLTEPKTDNEKFGEYIVSKLNKIYDDDIRDEIEEQIITIINASLKKCRELKK